MQPEMLAKALFLFLLPVCLCKEDDLQCMSLKLYIVINIHASL